MPDLSQLFNKLIACGMYEKIEGCLCERLPDDKFKWGNIAGTRSEIEAAIKEAGENLKNSIKRP